MKDTKEAIGILLDLEAIHSKAEAIMEFRNLIKENEELQEFVISAFIFSCLADPQYKKQKQERIDAYNQLIPYERKEYFAASTQESSP